MRRRFGSLAQETHLVTHTRTRLLGAGLVAALTSTAVLTAPPAAHAAPVYSELTIDPYQYASSVGACTDDSVIPDPASIALAENGAPMTAATSSPSAYHATGDPSDTITNTAAVQGTAVGTTAGGQPKSVSLSYAGSVKVVTSKPTSACNVEAVAGLEVDFKFTLTTPMWATLVAKHKGAGYVEAAIARVSDADTDWSGVYGSSMEDDGTSTLLLQPGSYRGYVEGDLRQRANSTRTVTGSGTASITFAPVGSASKAPAGKARKYVALPGARNCTARDATATLTAKKKLIKQIEKVTFTVNGKKATTLKGKKLKKGKSIALALADNTAADIAATVVLKNGKKRTVDASYLACTS